MHRLPSILIFELAAFGLALLAAAPISAGEPWIAPAPGDTHWEHQRFRRIERATVYDVIPATSAETGSSSVPSWRARSTCSASGMLLQVDGVDLRDTPLFSWNWRITEGLDLADEREASADDFAARVYVLFRAQTARLSVAQRLRRALAARLLDRPLPGTTLCYVWANGVPVGTLWTSPSEPSAKLIALRSGSASAARLGAWQPEQVDVLSDHRRGFGAGPIPEVLGIAIMTDSDSSCRTAGALYQGFMFTTQGRAAPHEPTNAVGHHGSDPSPKGP